LPPISGRCASRGKNALKACLLALALGTGLSAGAVRLGSVAIVSAHAAEQQALEIASKTGVHIFSVEVMVKEAERARGLMYRKEVPEGYGMLFDFEHEQDVAMWMENTYVSLDMVFIRSDGRILRIAENTQPLSRRTISSGGPVRAVLEVVGGTARTLGIAAGDQVGHPMFKLAR
jgi:uncharacterized membrane protein (UPF0127 family)